MTNSAIYTNGETTSSLVFQHPEEETTITTRDWQGTLQMLRQGEARKLGQGGDIIISTLWIGYQARRTTATLKARTAHRVDYQGYVKYPLNNKICEYSTVGNPYCDHNQNQSI